MYYTSIDIYRQTKIKKTFLNLWKVVKVFHFTQSETWYDGLKYRIYRYWTEKIFLFFKILEIEQESRVYEVNILPHFIVIRKNLA